MDLACKDNTVLIASCALLCYAMLCYTYRSSGYCSWSLRCADPSTKQQQIQIENKVFSWRTPVVLVALVVFCYLAKYGIEYYFDTRAEYQEIADAELNNDDKADA